jgi:Domain of unknown function (DUF1937)
MSEKVPTIAELVAMLWRPAEMWFNNKELLALRELITRAEERKGGYVYLASPYSHADPQVVQTRFKAAEVATAYLLKQSIWTYSPIVHCHALAEAHNFPTDAKYWQKYNHTMIDGAKALLVLKLTGWEASKGVTEEIEYATLVGIPVSDFVIGGNA